MKISTRGETAVGLSKTSSIDTLSIGGMPAAVPAGSVGVTPASSEYVAYLRKVASAKGDDANAYG
jgi:hypothetical protein